MIIFLILFRNFSKKALCWVNLYFYFFQSSLFFPEQQVDSDKSNIFIYHYLYVCLLHEGKEQKKKIVYSENVSCPIMLAIFFNLCVSGPYFRTSAISFILVPPSLSLSLSLFLSLSLPLSLPLCLCLSVSLCLSLFLSLCLSLCLSVSLSVCLSVSVSVSVSVSLSLSLSLSFTAPSYFDLLSPLLANTTKHTIQKMLLPMFCILKCSLSFVNDGQNVKPEHLPCLNTIKGMNL